MKRILAVILVLLMVIFISGCSSGNSRPTNDQAASSSPPAQEGSITETPAVPLADEGSTAPASERQAVPLSAGFPEEVPLVEGIVWECQEVKANTFRINIDSEMGSVAEIHAYYKSKLTKVTNEGYINNDAASPMAELDGLAGDWKVNVIAVQYGKDKPVEVTLVVKHKDA